jgi:gliding motility-associated-like protein
MVTTPVEYCKDDPATALTAQGQNLLWYSSVTGGIGSATPPVPSTATIGNTSYYVSQTIQGCESDRTAIEVQVNDKTEIHITLSKTAVCEFDTITITAVGANPPGATFIWSFDGGTVLSGTGIGPYKVRWSTEGTKTVTVNASNASCTASDSKQVTVNRSPRASFVLEPHACIDELMSIQAAWGNLENSAYTWNFDGATILTGSGPGAYKLKWHQPGIKVVSLTTFENGCKSEPFYDSIIVHADPVAEIEADGIKNLCSGDIIKVKARDENQALIYSYAWGPKEYFSLLGAQITQATVKATGFIHLTVTDPYGCDATDSLFVETKPCCDVYLPDAFTPNGDGLNDVFRLITIGNHKLTDFRVVNRWGQAVFEGGDIKSGWDGNLGGLPQPVGTYFYYLRYQCGTGAVIEKKGELTLIR